MPKEKSVADPVRGPGGSTFETCPTCKKSIHAAHMKTHNCDDTTTAPASTSGALATKADDKQKDKAKKESEPKEKKERKPRAKKEPKEKKEKEDKEDGSEEEEEKKPKKRKNAKEKPADGKPKAAISAYLHFTKAKRAEVVAAKPELKPKEVMSELGRLWKELDDDAKKEYQEMAEKDKKRYQEDCEASGYVAPPKKKKAPAKKKTKKAAVVEDDDDDDDDDDEDDE
eukprot:TRINITY_DN235_c0_g1_i1.p1 TRINITY_DN235_c0_g1~~TRINITY_DN235_c0_g1_i1.p1  ORF type:complete len:227 (-),score=91.67 TRINITY_DN235_c0_g1_i1:68-748(-)